MCGFALRRGEKQCGRCGESVSATEEREAPSSRETNFKLESIRVSSRQSAPLHSHVEAQTGDAQALDAFRSQIAELERKIEILNSGKATERAVENRGEVAKHFRYRKDPSFVAATMDHVMKMRRMRREMHKAPSTAPSFIPVPGNIAKPGIMRGSVLLFAGPPGTMKSTVAAFLSSTAAGADAGVLYILLNERRVHFVSRSRSTGIDISNLTLLDFVDLRSATAGYPGTWERAIMAYVQDQLKSMRFAIVVIDSVNSLLSMQSTERPRKQAFDMISKLRSLGVTAVLIEEGDYRSVVKRKTAEAYLCDGVFQFMTRKMQDGTLSRVMRVLKLRGSEIDPRFFTIQFSGKSIHLNPSIIQ